MATEQASFEPTVVSAVRRYWLLVLALTLAGAGVGVGLTKVIQPQFQGVAGVVISPPPATLSPSVSTGAGAASSQTSQSASADYTNQQLTLLQSQQVVARAVAIVRHDDPHSRLTSEHLANNLTVTPPTGSGSGTGTGSNSAATGANLNSLGTNATLVTATLPNARVAADAANAVLSAYQAVYEASIQAQATNARTQIARFRDQASLSLSTVSNQINALNEATSAPSTRTPSPANAQVQALQAQQSNLANQLSTLDQAMSQLQLNEQADLAATPVTVAATAPSKPINDSKIKYGGLGAAIGLIVAVVAAYVLALRRQRFSASREPERLFGAPQLGSVPVFAILRRHNSAGVALPVLTDTATEEADGYVMVATSLRVLKGQRPSLSVAVTSGSRGAGKSTVVANVAIALSTMGERVLVVDADPEGASLTRVFTPELSDGPDLAGALTGLPLTEAAIRGNLNPARLFVLRAPGEEFATHRWSHGAFRDLMAEAERLFDVVLVDVPPLGETSFGVDVTCAVGRALLVVPHGERTRPQDEVRASLALGHVELLGYVYNRAPRRPGFKPYLTRTLSLAGTPGTQTAIQNGSSATTRLTPGSHPHDDPLSPSEPGGSGEGQQESPAT